MVPFVTVQMKKKKSYHFNIFVNIYAVSNCVIFIVIFLCLFEMSSILNEIDCIFTATIVCSPICLSFFFCVGVVFRLQDTFDTDSFKKGKYFDR